MNRHRDLNVPGPRSNRSGRIRAGLGRDESGQALVELALVLPLMALLLGTAFNGWSAMQLSVRLTSAARAGAIEAANDLANAPAQTQTAWNDATSAVIQEEGDTTVYQNTNPSANDYVGMSVTTQAQNGVTINVVTITITEPSVAFVPFVHDLSVGVHATARYS